MSPEEIVQIAEYSYGSKSAPCFQGFPEEEVAAAETSLGIRIPAAYGKYLKICGKASLNEIMHQLLEPAEISFSYDCIEEILADLSEEWVSDPPKADNPFYRISRIPRENWKVFTRNYLILWVENQGVFHAGFRVEDLDQDSPEVYWTTDNSYFEWEKVSNSTESFLLFMLMEALSYRADKKLSDSQEIEAAFTKYQIDTARLFPQEPPFKSQYVRSFWMAEEKVMGIYLLKRGEENLDGTLYLYELPGN